MCERRGGPRRRRGLGAPGLSVLGTALLVVGLMASGCRGCGPSEERGPAGMVGQVPEPSPSSQASGSGPRVVLRGPWEQAATGDGLALARIAELYDATELWALASEPGERGRVALEVLVQADDAERVLGAMAEAARAASERREELLRVIVRLASRPPRRGEALDAPSVARAVAALDALARDDGVDKSARALSVSALRALARAGYLEASTIPTSVDPAAYPP